MQGIGERDLLMEKKKKLAGSEWKILESDKVTFNEEVMDWTSKCIFDKARN